MATRGFIRKYYRSRALLGFILSHKHFVAARPARFLYFIRRPNFRPSSRFHFPCRSSSSRIEFRGVGGSDLFCNAFKDSPATPTVGGRFFSCSASSASPARRIRRRFQGFSDVGAFSCQGRFCPIFSAWVRVSFFKDFSRRIPSSLDLVSV